MTILDVAKRAQVDYSTVSLALRGDKRISTKTRERVEVAAKALSYTPNHVARSLSGGATKIIGVMLTEMSHYFSRPFEIMQTIGENAGYSLSVHFSSWKADREEQALRHFCENRTDGVIWAPSQWADESFLRMMEMLDKHRAPCVLLGLAHCDVACHEVGGIKEDPIRMALSHLQKLGHRRISLATADQMPGNRGRMHRLRLPAFQSVFAEHGMTLRNDDIFETSNHDHGGLEIALELSRRPREAWPTAVLAADDMLARSLAAGFNALGVNVPGDISLMGFDVVQDDVLGQQTLTSVSLAAEEMAEQAIRLILADLQSSNYEHNKKQIIIPPKLIVGASCGLCRKL